MGAGRGVHAVPRVTRGRRRDPKALQRRKQGEIDRLLEEGRARIGRLSDREFLVAGVALYAGEGSKRDGSVVFANSDPRMVVFFCSWLRHFFEVDESRLRVRLYPHQGLDLAAAIAFWSELTGIPASQFVKPYRAVPDPSIRTAKHVHGCVGVRYSCSDPPKHHGARRRAAERRCHSGVAQSAERLPVKEMVASSSLAPGATF